MAEEVSEKKVSEFNVTLLNQRFEEVEKDCQITLNEKKITFTSKNEEHTDQLIQNKIKTHPKRSGVIQLTISDQTLILEFEPVESLNDFLEYIRLQSLETEAPPNQDDGQTPKPTEDEIKEKDFTVDILDKKFEKAADGKIHLDQKNISLFFESRTHTHEIGKGLKLRAHPQRTTVILVSFEKKQSVCSRLKETFIVSFESETIRSEFFEIFKHFSSILRETVSKPEEKQEKTEEKEKEAEKKEDNQEPLPEDALSFNVSVMNKQLEKIDDAQFIFSKTKIKLSSNKESHEGIFNKKTKIQRSNKDKDVVKISISKPKKSAWSCMSIDSFIIKMQSEEDANNLISNYESFQKLIQPQEKKPEKKEDEKEDEKEKEKEKDDEKEKEKDDEKKDDEKKDDEKKDDEKKDDEKKDDEKDDN
ncbi:transcription elongation factor a [Anaeramoeba ignava]|uniref:Transcription elongation factor a n=1 Tax=Anaeramoeba ignava TaxID=1746090 RepID=A0A9Q0RCK9_ANAIG|nr:transcription elongation factor a [Anaeramoeba ignava]